ncbi:MAG: M56 family metallopeptidase [Blastocatellales bacterium]
MRMTVVISGISTMKWDSFFSLNPFQFWLDLTIKSVIVLLTAWLLASLLRGASAAVRHWVWNVSIASLLALPILSLVLPGWRVEILPSIPDQTIAVRQSTSERPVAKVYSQTNRSRSIASEAQNVSAAPTGIAQSLSFPLDSAPVAPVQPRPGTWLIPANFESINWVKMTLSFWVTCAFLILARLLASMFKIRRLARSANQINEGSWISLSQNVAVKLGLRCSIELLKSEKVALPMTWGAWSSVVMLPADADRWLDECRSVVLLHEMAHIKRRDCLTQNLAQLACALYWFNPLVWMAARRLHIERELACDDQVLEVGTKASDYACHLVEIARSFSVGQRPFPVAVGMACSQLENRVRSILDPAARQRRLNRLTAGLITLGAVCLILSLAVVHPAMKTAASPAVDQTPVGLADDEIDLRAISVLTDAQSNTSISFPGKGTDANSSSEGLQTAEAECCQEDEDDAQNGGQGKALSSELTADQIIELKMHDVSPEFIESMRKAGLDNLTIRELSQLRIHGITEEFVRQARGWSKNPITARDLIQLKVSGVSAEYINTMKQAGYDGLTLNQLSSLSIHGVSPDYVASLRGLGYENLSADRLASLKIHGIDEAFIKEMQSWMGGKPSVNELLKVKIHGVSPEYAREMKSLGFDNIPINKLSEMKIHGVSAQYIREMRELGFDNLTVDQLIKMRIHGVDTDYVEKMRAAGLKNVSVDQMIEMKIHGIDSILFKDKR